MREIDKTKKCVVVIPIYKADMNKDEICSLIQCKKVLKDYDIKIVCPESLNTKNYEEEGIFNIVRMPDERFEDTYSYSRMLLNKEFYEKFKEYDYMLIYQLDAWVFEDRLQEWCDKDYDYVGSPWFERYNVTDPKSKMLKYAGNGGFSLRKISTFINVLSDAETSDAKMKTFMEIYTKAGQSSIFNIFRLPKSVKRYFSQDNLVKNAVKASELWEDNAIVNNLRAVYKMNVSLSKDAKYFAFEAHPERLYNECGEKLPFGCHGYKKYGWDFWKKFINTEPEFAVSEQ